MSKQLNESNYYQTVRNTSGLVLVDFYTTWCGPCRMLSPILEQLQDVEVLKVDGDQNMNLVKEEGISAYPTLIFYRGGQEVGRILGLQNLMKLQEMVNTYNEG